MSALTVTFILHVVSVTGSSCTQRLNGTGEFSVSNLMHLGSSLSTILSFMLPTGATLTLTESRSNAKSFTWSAGMRSFILSMLFRSLSVLYTAVCGCGICLTPLSYLLIVLKNSSPSRPPPRGRGLITVTIMLMRQTAFQGCLPVCYPHDCSLLRKWLIPFYFITFLSEDFIYVLFVFNQGYNDVGKAFSPFLVFSGVFKIGCV